MGVNSAVLIGVPWTLLAIGSFFVLLRSIFAREVNGKLRWDFIWTVVTWTFATTSACLLINAVKHGLGQHMVHLTLPEIVDVLHQYYAIIMVGCITLLTGKFAIIALLLHMQSGTRLRARYVLHGVAVVLTITTVLEMIITMTQCRPYTKLWNILEPGTCPYQKLARGVSYLHAATSAVSDIILAAWPIGLMWKIQITRNTKIAFCAIMALGVVPAVASFVRIVLLVRLYAGTDPTYDLGRFLIWASLETGAMTLISSLPPLRPVFLRFIYGNKRPQTGVVSKTDGNTTVASRMERLRNLRDNEAMLKSSAFDEEVEVGPVMDQVVVTSTFGFEKTSTPQHDQK